MNGHEVIQWTEVVTGKTVESCPHCGTNVAHFEHVDCSAAARRNFINFEDRWPREFKYARDMFMLHARSTPPLSTTPFHEPESVPDEIVRQRKMRLFDWKKYTGIDVRSIK